VVSQGRFSSWLTTVDHKRIGILYIVTSLTFFGLGGLLALLMRARPRTTGRRPGRSGKPSSRAVTGRVSAGHR
jgi:heme/copper-type cytochrome/quinol oxidase subunit 1